jgi:hypothetical protein
MYQDSQMIMLWYSSDLIHEYMYRITNNLTTTPLP